MDRKRKFQTNGEDEPSFKIQKTEDNETQEHCKDECTSHKINSFTPEDNDSITILESL